MTENSTIAVAYYRTSSATNVGDNKDSLRRQQEAVRAFADVGGRGPGPSVNQSSDYLTTIGA